MTTSELEVCAEKASDAPRRAPNPTAEAILCWANERGIQRLRSNRKTGPPDSEHLEQWSGILGSRDIADSAEIFAVLDAARRAADRTGEWRSWAFLTLQIQLAVESIEIGKSLRAETRSLPVVVVGEDPTCEWARAKAEIRKQLAEIPFINWFDRTRQVERSGAVVTVAVPNEPTRSYVESEYRSLVDSVVCSLDLGVATVRFVVCGTGSPP